MKVSQNQMALALRVSARRINEIIHGKRRITADTALRLACRYCVGRWPSRVGRWRFRGQ
jgi:addiction module HigA family antidote